MYLCSRAYNVLEKLIKVQENPFILKLKYHFINVKFTILNSVSLFLLTLFAFWHNSYQNDENSKFTGDMIHKNNHAYS